MTLSQTVVTVLIFLHPMFAIGILVGLGLALRQAKSLRFSLGAALFYSILLGALLGVLMYVGENSSFNLMGILFFLPPLPIWVLAGAEYVARRRAASFIAVREALSGALLGGLVYALITAFLFFLMNCCGVH